MSKIAIMTDSNSGITQEEAKALGIHVLPMPFLMGEETFFEDINLTQNEFYEKLKGGCSISTSQPSPESVLTMFDTLLREYDEVVHIPMSSGLSCWSCHGNDHSQSHNEGKLLKETLHHNFLLKYYIFPFLCNFYARKSVNK